MVESPEYMWPDDRIWVVCTNYDLTSTYIACSRELADVLNSSPGLETLEVSRRSRIDERSDEDELS